MGATVAGAMIDLEFLNPDSVHVRQLAPQCRHRAFDAHCLASDVHMRQNRVDDGT